MLTDIFELNTRNKSFENGIAPLSKDVFRFEKVIGNGSFGKVYTAISKNTGNSYAIKMLNKDFIQGLTLIEQLRNEITILLRCTHENIVKIFGCFEDAAQIYIVMELAEESLFKKLVGAKSFSEAQVAEILSQVARALAYLHSLTPPVLHRDLKPENVLCIKGRYVLADFGWSNIDNNVRNTFCGTPDYLAPEMINGKGHNEKLDIWTLGVLMYELLVGRPPFSFKQKTTDKRLYQKMTEKNILELNIDIPSTLSLDAVNCIKKLMSPEPSLRPSANGVIEMPFFLKNKRRASVNPRIGQSPGTTMTANLETQIKINAQLNKELNKIRKEVEILRSEVAANRVNIDKEQVEELKKQNCKLNTDIAILKAKSNKDDEIKHYLFEKGKKMASFISEFHQQNLESDLSMTMDNVLSYENALGKLEHIFREFLKLKGKSPDIINETLPHFDPEESQVVFGTKYGTVLTPTVPVKITNNDKHNAQNTGNFFKR